MTSKEPTGLYIVWIREEGGQLVARNKHRQKVAWGAVPGWKDMNPRAAACQIFHSDEIGGCAFSTEDNAILCEVWKWD